MANLFYTVDGGTSGTTGADWANAKVGIEPTGADGHSARSRSQNTPAEKLTMRG